MRERATADVAEDSTGLNAPGMSSSQRDILVLLKRRGRCTIPELAKETGLNIETVRHHLRGLEAMGYADRFGTRPLRPGRPELEYGLTRASESLFPRREGELLQGRAKHLKETGNEQLLEDFFASYIGARRSAALARVAELSGTARVKEAAAILSELGFMAETGSDSGSDLRLCHCPLRDLVKVSKVPCRAELGFVRELLGHPHLTRLAYIPAGDTSCSYRGDAT
jgi:predicted ArsR family transcriptional regulator